MLNQLTQELIRIALEEDVGAGDITTDSLVPADQQANARIFAKQELVVCGHEVARAVFCKLEPKIHYEIIVPDGGRVSRGEDIARVSGKLRSILTAERTALNFLQHLSGISTRTARAVEQLGSSGVRVLDTRKTIPGFRELDKYAVKIGGGTNHRHGLYDAVLIKNNHLKGLAGDIERAVTQARHAAPKGTKIQVEVRTESELRRAIDAKPDAILLDNMNEEELRRAIEIVRSSVDGEKIVTEASGGITIDNLCEYAIPGLTFVSMGSLTHSSPAADIALHLL